jgi:ricin-type beta-trefoil lectin protein
MAVSEAPNFQANWPDVGAPGPVDPSQSGSPEGSSHSPGTTNGPHSTPAPGKSQDPAGEGGDQRGGAVGTENGGTDGRKGGSSDQNGSNDTSTSPPVTESDAGSNPVGVVSLTNVASGTCIDIIGDFGRPDGTKLQLWQCAGTDWQHWEFMSDHTLRSLGKCMDVIGGSAAAGAGVDWTTCNGADSQQFGMNKSGGLVNLASRACVMPTGGQTTEGTLLVLAACGSQSAQKWSTG